VLSVTGYAKNAAIVNGLFDVGMRVTTKRVVVGDVGKKVRKMLES
jgi:hypothetical protein